MAPARRALPLPARSARRLRPAPGGRPRAAHPRARRASSRSTAGSARRRRAASALLREIVERRGTGSDYERDRRPRLRLRPRTAWRASAPTTSRQENGAGAVFRIIPEQIVPLEELKLPPAIEGFAHLPAGPRAGDRTDRLGQVDDARRDHRPDQHDLLAGTSSPSRTRSSSCTPNKRVGVLAARGRRTTPRASPTRCAPPSARTPTSSWSARCATSRPSRWPITAAEMGVLVFGTLHTNGAAKTIDRLIDAFPADQQAQVAHHARRVAGRRRLAAPAADRRRQGPRGGERDPAQTPGLPNVIREGNTPMITLAHPVREERRACSSMDDALMALVEQKRIAPRDAYLKATDKARFENLIRTDGAYAVSRRLSPAELGRSLRSSRA